MNITKQYVLFSEAWYKDNPQDKGAVDRVTFTTYTPGVSGEMHMVWHTIGLDKPAPRLEVFDDAWQALAQCRDVLDAMATVDNESITPKQFCELLDQCEFVDVTPRDDPRK